MFYESNQKYTIVYPSFGKSDALLLVGRPTCISTK